MPMLDTLNGRDMILWAALAVCVVVIVWAIKRGIDELIALWPDLWHDDGEDDE